MGKIIEYIKKHFFPEQELMENTITCEDVLSEQVCKALKEAAEKLKVKAAEVDKIVREAVKKGITKAKEIIKIVRAKIIEMATNFKCEDALSADVCKKMREVAAELKVKFAKVMKVMKEIIAKGITKAKEIIEEIKKHFFPGQDLIIENEIIKLVRAKIVELATNLKCEDVLRADWCAKIK